MVSCLKGATPCLAPRQAQTIWPPAPFIPFGGLRTCFDRLRTNGSGKLGHSVVLDAGIHSGANGGGDPLGDMHPHSLEAMQGSPWYIDVAQPVGIFIRECS